MVSPLNVLIHAVVVAARLLQAAVTLEPIAGRQVSGWALAPRRMGCSPTGYWEATKTDASGAFVNFLVGPGQG